MVILDLYIIYMSVPLEKVCIFIRNKRYQFFMYHKIAKSNQLRQAKISFLKFLGAKEHFIKNRKMKKMPL